MYRFACSNFAVLPLLVSAAVSLPAIGRAAAKPVWLSPAVTLDESISPQLAANVTGCIEKGVRASLGGALLSGPAALLKVPVAEDGRVVQARQLLERGEALYEDFSFGPAAASLAEAAGLFTAALATLSTEDTQRLYQARLLEGLVWLGEGQTAAAEAAFGRLITIRPDYEPDASMMPPEGLPVFDAARRTVRRRGVGSLLVRTEPPGATVIVDGVVRGQSPVSITGLHAGSHGLRVVASAFVVHSEEIVITRGKSATRDFALLRVPVMAAYDRVVTAALGGSPAALVADDLGLIAETVGADAVLLVGVARVAKHVLITARRWSPMDDGGDSGGDGVRIVARASETELPGVCAQVAKALAGNSWLGGQIPEGSVPVAVNFARGLLGVGPGWGREEVSGDSGLLSSWWFWSGVGVVVAGAGVGAAMVLASGEETPPDAMQVGIRVAQ